MTNSESGTVVVDNTSAAESNVPMPKSHDDAVLLISSIGYADVDLQKLEANRAQAIARATERYDGRITAIKQRNAERHAVLLQWATANKKVLLNGGTARSASLGPHLLQWRAGSPRVELVATLANVLAEIKKKRWASSFIRTKEELDKEALLKDADRAIRIPGVRIMVGDDSFSVKPFAGSAFTSVKP